MNQDKCISHTLELKMYTNTTVYSFDYQRNVSNTIE